MKRIACLCFCLLALLAAPAIVDAATKARIVFTTDLGGLPQDIWVMDSGGGNQTQLTFGVGANSTEPSICGNARNVVFRRSYDIFRIENNGANETNLTNSPAADHDVYCGRFVGDVTDTIVFISNMDTSPSEIYSMDLNGGNVTRLTNNSVSENSPSVCGDKIIFTRFQNSASSMWIMDRDGTNQRQLTCLPGEYVADPHCDEDGVNIVYGRRPIVPEDYEVHTMPLCPGTCCTGEVRLTFNDVEDFHFGWAPGGRRIVWANPIDGDWEIYVMDSLQGDSGPVYNLTNNTDGDIHPEWGYLKTLSVGPPNP